MARGILKAAGVYPTYFFKEKDPEIDVMRTRVDDLAKANNVSKGWVIREACRRSRVSPNTVHGWFEGGTRKPQSATLKAFGNALGGSNKWSWASARAWAK